MPTLAAIYRFLQLLAHSGHHMAKGCCFVQDHAFLGELYRAYETAFDVLCERMIGCGDVMEVKERLAIDAKAARYLSQVEAGELDEAEDYYDLILEMEVELCAKIEKLSKEKVSQGTLNLLAQLADDSEVRQYKLNRILDEEGNSTDASEDDATKEKA